MAEQAEDDLDQLSKATRKLVEDFKKGGAGIVEAAKTAAKGLIESLDMGTEISGVSKTFNAVADTGKAAITGVQGIASGLLGAIPIVGGFASAVVNAGAELAKAAITAGQTMVNTLAPMAQKQMETFRSVSQVGGYATGSLQGFADTAKKANLLTDQFGKIIVENSEKMTFMGGTVSENAVKVAGAMQSMRKGSAETFETLRNVGYSYEELTDITARYGSMMARSGANLNTEQLGKSAAKYMVELDGLSRVTGRNKKDLVAEQEKRQSDARWRAMEAKLTSEGKHAELAEMKKTLAMLPEGAKQGMQDMFASGGVANTEAAKAHLISTKNQAGEAAKAISEGRMTAAGGMAIMKKGAKEYTDSMGNVIRFIGEDALATKNAVAAYDMQNQKIGENTKKTAAEQAKSAQGGVKSLLSLEDSQRDFAMKMQDLSIKVLPKFAEVMTKFNEYALKGVEEIVAGGEKFLNYVIGTTAASDDEKDEDPELRKHLRKQYEQMAYEATGKENEAKRAHLMKLAQSSSKEMAANASTWGVRGKEEGMVTRGWRATRNALGATDNSIAGQLAGDSKTTGNYAAGTGSAKGNVLSGPTSGYLEKLHGTEAVVPLPDGRSIPVTLNTAGLEGLLSQLVSKMDDLISINENQHRSLGRMASDM